MQSISDNLPTRSRADKNETRIQVIRLALASSKHNLDVQYAVLEAKLAAEQFNTSFAINY